MPSLLTFAAVMTEPVMIVGAFVALQSGHTWLAFTTARLVVADRILAARLIAIARQTGGRQ